MLKIFAEPFTVAKAAERLWMLDPSRARKALDLLARCGATRRAQPPAAGSVPRSHALVRGCARSSASPVVGLRDHVVVHIIVFSLKVAVVEIIGPGARLQGLILVVKS